jgi:tetratricopeptide (TPR) repeat protein
MANRGDRAQDRRNRWDNWHDRHYGHHGHWHHGHWHGHWGPGSRWNYWWDRYPVLTAFGVTTWAVNRVGWAFGYNRYSNPYAVVVVDNSTYNYSEPIIMTPDEQSLAADPDDTSPPPGASEEAMSTFDNAQKQFYDGDYPAALNSVNAALNEMPNDTVIHEFLALVLFALGEYPDAAATLYAVLSVGPGWDWTTMSSLYPQVSVYTGQLRELETFRSKSPQDAAACFVLAYHYITCNHNDAAIDQLKQLVKLQPKDQLAATLLQQLDPEAKIPEQPEITKPPETVPDVSKKQLQGTWRAKRASGEQYRLSLDGKDTFVWIYTPAKGNKQEVTGVYAVEKDGVLALEMNDEGTMLAQIDVKGNKMDFYMLGDTQGVEPLHFAKE